MKKCKGRSKHVFPSGKYGERCIQCQKKNKKKLCVLRVFDGHRYDYYVLVKDVKHWFWLDLKGGHDFSGGHETKKDAFILAREQGIIKKIKLKF